MNELDQHKRHAAPLVALLRESKREHYCHGDITLCCTKVIDSRSACTCGADEWNARVDAMLGSL